MKEKDVLTQKSYKTYDYISRYASFPTFFNTLDGKYVYGTTSQLKKDNTYVLHEVVRGDTYDSLSLYYYNTPLYYWVICDFNDIQDPIEKPPIGSKLKIPTLTAINFTEV